ncbi:MAG: tyrosine--tRNA ligase [Actinobacteria bacterium]|nr:tyrosine--tRNA ligase [Actinomycetota bacterium]
MNLIDDLDARGLIHDTTDRSALAARLADGPITFYYGCDPSADSLHAGNLIGLLTARRFQLAGHKPIMLAGGATGMIGDPSGRSDERKLLDDDALANNLSFIVPQLEQFVDFGSRPNGAKLVDNRAWTVGVSILDFLRDIGKHVTVNQMLAKESVKARLRGDGLSYTEFSYMLLQAYDYLWLAENEGCDLQIGGSDQWGNIVLGADLIRRKLQRRVHALTWPLLTKRDGTKYGKTAGGETMWLGAHRLSPYGFYQGWIGADDHDLRKLLLQLTFMSVADVDDTLEAHNRNPGDRLGQRTLAHELCVLVHGQAAAKGAAEASGLLFGGGDVTSASAEAFEQLAAELPTTLVDGTGGAVLDILVQAGLASSRSDAKRAMGEGSIYVDGERVSDLDAELGATPLAGGHHLLRRGKKKWHLIRKADSNRF